MQRQYREVRRASPLNANLPAKGPLKIGVLADTHLGSRFQQLTALYEFYDYACRQGVQAFVHAGDLTDGPYTMHVGMIHDQFIHRYDEAVAYCIDVYPRHEKPTYMITGNHDLSWVKNNGGNIVRDVCRARDDLHFVADNMGYVKLGSLKWCLFHGTGAVPYAMSYRLQKTVESFSSENKPHLLVKGHHHMALQIFIRNVLCFEAGCFQAQTNFLASKNLHPQIGGWIVEIDQASRGKGNVRTEFVPFFTPKPRDY